MSDVFRVRRTANADESFKPGINDAGPQWPSVYPASGIRTRRLSDTAARLSNLSAINQPMRGDSYPWPQTRGRRPIRNNTKATINPITNRIHAMFAAAPATPLNPRTPAIKATTKNISAQVNMSTPQRCE